MKNHQQAETYKQAALAREKNRLAMKNQRQAETADHAAFARERNKLAKRRKLQHGNDKFDSDMEKLINKSMKESVKYLHRKKDSENPHKHRAIVCIICNHCIIGTEAINNLTKEQILLHEKSVSVESYEEYYETKLKYEVKK